MLDAPKNPTMPSCSRTPRVRAELPRLVESGIPYVPGGRYHFFGPSGSGTTDPIVTDSFPPAVTSTMNSSL